ncbi:MAG: UDP-N-acetylglucosamine 2-epimerase (hydrolyzing) [Brevundimonas sp.]|uniref:UDP-N-acetylglucosamine 2-epimerase n=1 Tax=Brevundimonas sp. TaxID=1871086 RepID=UPI00181D281C|nr:UDP-N-acetylglucosamine 2-epimerase [Brevundimonas sp.]MBA4804671.1 UDP-N-acetylglucosamine 2-epimerase (hydrolyzing) [Brevundimonas sp.]
MSGKRLCVVTGSRAEYGILYWLLRDIRDAPDLDLQLVVTGMHLEPRFGMTVEQIERDGFAIDWKAPIGLEEDTPGGIAHAMARGLAGVSDALEALRPDLVIVLGDRFEIMVAVQAAMIHNVPVAHLAGGDTTEGAFDEGIRHAITKMAHVHLTTNSQSAHRVAQMGEDPARIHVVGSPALDHLKRARLMDQDELERSLGAPLGARNLLVTFHPVTLEPDYGMGQFEALLEALDGLDRNVVKWFTRPNADPGNVALNARLDHWAEGREDVQVHTSLGQARYLALLSRVDAMVGNSSSGLYEAPSLGTATVNIGNRQAGRLAADSVINAAPVAAEIGHAIRRAMEMDCSGVSNPYGDGHASERILSVLRALPSRSDLLRKKFHETYNG